MLYVDYDSNKVLDFGEYCQLIYIFQNHIPDNLPHFLFLIADKNCNCYVNVDELKHLFRLINAGLSDQEVEKLAVHCSKREDGILSYSNFISMVKQLLE